MAKGVIVQNLKKSYKNVDVLKSVSFEVQPGAIFALLGKNGAGKTTTINILTTLIKGDGGTATIDDVDVNTRPATIRQHISLTGQFAAIDPVLTARENLRLIADLRHSKHPAQVAAGLLERFDLTKAADRRVQTFSGGMRRRLDIAMSLIGDPSVIFLDEPTTGLDPEARRDMWQTIRRLAKDGKTVFLTTQYLEEADELADTIAILHEGIIVATGTAAELKKLVPQGFIDLQFATKKEAEVAAKALKAYAVTHTDTSLRVATEGTPRQIAEIFLALQAAHTEPTEFSQITPTLDDVFFAITKNKKGGTQ